MNFAIAFAISLYVRKNCLKQYFFFLTKRSYMKPSGSILLKNNTLKFFYRIPSESHPC